MPPERRRLRIVSGGQTGADRAALDVALELGLPTGGWVSAGRLAEDGRIPPVYPGLREAPSDDPALRTELNVADADGTLVVLHGEPAGGTRLTIELARRRRKPLLVLDFDGLSTERAAARVSDWLEDNDIGVLNVAGPRASEDATIYSSAAELLRRVLPTL